MKSEIILQEESNIDILVKQGFSDLVSDLDNAQMEYINPKSIQNFIYHLVDNPKTNLNQIKKLQELGELRMKKKLLEFYAEVRNSDLDKNTAAEFYKKHIFYVGSFMAKYYGFSATGGKIVVFTILIILTIGVTADTIIHLFGFLKFPFFTITFLLFYLVRRLNKIRNKKLFGLYY